MSPINNDDVEKILSQAGPRVKPDAEVRSEVYQAVHDAWEQSHKVPFYKAHAMKIAASIALFGSLFTWLLLNPQITTSESISQYVLIQGQVQKSSDNSSWTLLKKDQSIHQGDYLKTQKKNRLLIKLLNGNQLRVDEHTILRFESDQHVELLFGRIYIDSNEDSENNELSIKTPVAEINHMGTQYSVSYKDQQLDVSVREGLVTITNERLVESQLPEGQSFSLDHLGVISIGVVTPFDQSWKWTQLISDRFDIQDKTLVEYLQWVSNETGFPIKYQSDELKSRVTKVILSGSINGISPLKSLDVIMPTTRYQYTLQDNQIYIIDGSR